MDNDTSVAIITGASRGLGAALARELARQGYGVLGVARGEAALSETTDAIVATGGRARAFADDVSAPEAARRIVGRAEAMGPVEVLVLCASDLGPTPLRPLLDLDEADFDAVIATNLGASFRLARAALGAMALRGRGVVVFVSSDAAVAAYPGWGAYGATKAAADHLARTFAAELGDRGVRVFSVDPGEMDTAMHAAAMPDADRDSLANLEVIAQIIARCIADPDLAPNGARVLASEVAS